MRRHRVLLAASCLMLAGCGDDSTGPSGLSGTASFSYSGATSGSFSATGGIPISNEPETVPWAVGFREESEGMVVVSASVPRSSTTHDFLLLQVPLLTSGSVTITDNCQADNCAAVLIDLNVDNSSGDSEFFCGLLNGTISITSINSNRVQGTFSGSGECITATGTETFAVSNGTFNVALISDFVLLAAIRSP